MKNLLFLLLIPFGAFAQYRSQCEKDLLEIAERREYIVNGKFSDEFNPIDSLVTYNDKLQHRLLDCLQTRESLEKPFVSLEKYNIGATGSPDGLFRIYTWDDQTGGTMRYGMNVFQFSDGRRVHAQLPVWDRSGGDDSIDSYFYDVLDEVVSEGKKFYVVMAVHVGSSAVSAHKIKIFSIDDGALNHGAALIKTKTGIRNELAYEVDFTNEANRTGEMPDREWAWIEYDAKTKTISIPLIREDGKITSKRIRYRFNGKHFQKI